VGRVKRHECEELHLEAMGCRLCSEAWEAWQEQLACAERSVRAIDAALRRPGTESDRLALISKIVTDWFVERAMREHK
jgi:hypothetical protein